MFFLDCEENNELFNSVANTAFLYLGLKGEAYIELELVSGGEIKELNLRTRNKNEITDVLSYPNLTEIKDFNLKNYPLDFDSEKKAVFLGSVVICLERAREQADEYGHSERREAAYLFLHGLLHLLGYDHMTEQDKSVMRRIEEEILSKEIF